MSTLKTLNENQEGLDEEEKEHSRLMKEQENCEKESMHDEPNLDDEEYARMIAISESHSRGDTKMAGLDIEDEEEEKKPLNYRKHSRRGYQPADMDSEEDDDHHRNDESFAKVRSGFNSYDSPFKKQASPVSSFMRRGELTRDTDSSNKFWTPQKYQNTAPYNQNLSSFDRRPFTSQRDLNEEFRQEVVQQVKVRVEELQSKMKSKSDMFYVLRHMCKSLAVYQFRRLSPSRIWRLSDSVYERHFNRIKEGKLVNLV